MRKTFAVVAILVVLLGAALLVYVLRTPASLASDSAETARADDPLSSLALEPQSDAAMSVAPAADTSGSLGGTIGSTSELFPELAEENFEWSEASLENISWG